MTKINLSELRRLYEIMTDSDSVGDACAFSDSVVPALPALLAVAEAARELMHVHECGCGYCNYLRAALEQVEG